MVTGILFYLSSSHINQEPMSRILSDGFIKELNKRNLVVDHEEGETFTLMSVVDPSRKTTIQFFST
jgi:dTDP-glucose pyrophosphorylase